MFVFLSSLNERLLQMGLDIIFNKEKADFKGMLVPKCERSLSVDKIFQKAYIDVNEEGSEAAAVTGKIQRTTF